MLISSCAVVCWMETSCVGQLKAPVVKQNRSNWSGKFEDFSEPTGKGVQWTIRLCVGGKNRAADLNFREKTASRPRSFETVVSNLDFVYRKLRQTPENPQKKTK